MRAKRHKRGGNEYHTGKKVRSLKIEYRKRSPEMVASIKKSVLEAMQQGYNLQEACQQNNVPVRTFRNWLKNDDILRTAINGLGYNIKP